ncbi:MAG: membrane protein insertase YidC [Bryobacterales bacterium]|nr:membrane protein insertase YidC [Bryobacterales bacterium]
MPEIPTGQTPNRAAGKPKGEISVERRMLLALVLMGAVLIGSQYLFRAFGPPPEATLTPVAETAESKGGTPSAEPATAAAPVAPASSPSIEASPASPAAIRRAETEELFIVETNLVKVTFSNRGAVVRSWTIKDHKSTDGSPLELVNQAAFAKVGEPFSIQLRGQKAPIDANKDLYVANVSENGRHIEFLLSNGTWTFRKVFEIEESSYRARVRSEVMNGQSPVPHLLAWRGGFGDSSVDKRQDFQTAALYDQPRGKVETRTAGDASDAPLVLPGVYDFAGLQDKYFAAMFLPTERGTVEFDVSADSVPYNGDEVENNHVGIAIGGAGVNDFGLFVGPKNIDILKSIHPKLASLVDFGWFFFIAEPLFLSLNWLADNHLHNFGWAIVVLTIGINFVMLPLKITSMKSMKKMQALQPQIQAINDRYKGISLRDPRKQQQNQEVMELYQKNGVNPAAGCVPMLLQIPFFFAFYQVLSVAIELRGANWLWVDDLSRPESFAIRILPLTMVVSQIFMQRLTPTPSTDPTQKMMMNTMPLVFGVIFWWASSGLVLYWLTSNLVGIVQQLFINKFTDNTALVPVVAEKKSIKRRK